jgi:hypothetical protein
VVWEDDRNVVSRGWDIWGQRISATGARLGSNFRISGVGATGDERAPDVAHGAGVDQYMVVWMDDRDGATRGWDIWGRRVAASGARVGANFRISRAAATGNEEVASIAYNSTTGQYFVVWEDDRDSATRGTDIRGQRLSSAGARLGPNILVSGPTATDNEDTPAVAYNPAANQYRVVWSDDREMLTRGWDIRGQRVSAIGARLGPNLRISDGAATGDEYYAAVVFNTTVNRFLVAWSDGRNPGTRGMDIWAQQLYSTGGRYGANFRLSGGAATNDEYAPSIASSSGSDRYFGVWEDDRHFINRSWDVWGQLGEM